jgi:hypothetical protein
MLPLLQKERYGKLKRMVTWVQQKSLIIHQRLKRYLELIKSAKFEILLICPTVNAFLREYRIGAVRLFKEISAAGADPELDDNDMLAKEKKKEQKEIGLILRF